MAPVSFETAAYKARLLADWDGLSAPWESWSEAFESGGRAVTEKILELAGVGSGMRVLDVATGLGELAAEAARRAGPQSSILGIDLAPTMIAAASRRHCPGNLEFEVRDMEASGLPDRRFNVVLSRFGLMFAADQDVVLSELARVLVPGGVLAAAVWGPPAHHLLSAGPAALFEHLGLPPAVSDSPGPFAMSDPERLATALAHAGFREVSIDPIVAPYRFTSVADYVRFCVAMLPESVRKVVVDRVGAADGSEVWELLAAPVGRHVDDRGAVDLPSLVFCLRAVAA